MTTLSNRPTGVDGLRSRPTMRDVAALAGYVQGQSGQRYVFVAIVNHPQAALARPALDRLLEWTVQDKARH